MDCVLFRHGIAVKRGEWKGSEEARPLTGKGKKKIQQAAAGLAALELVPTHLLSSPLVRARDTAKLLRVELCPSIQIIQRDELAPGSTPEGLATFLRGLPPHAVVVCVGHEPLLGESAGFFLSARPYHGFVLKKAGGCLIHFPDSVKPGQGLLCWWLQPAHLRALGKEQKLHGK